MAARSHQTGFYVLKFTVFLCTDSHLNFLIVTWQHSLQYRLGAVSRRDGCNTSKVYKRRLQDCRRVTECRQNVWPIMHFYSPSVNATLPGSNAAYSAQTLNPSIQSILSLGVIWVWKGDKRPSNIVSTHEHISCNRGEKGQITKQKYFLNDDSDDVKTERSEKPTLKRICPNLSNQLLLKLKFITPMVDLPLSPNPPPPNSTTLP